MKNNENKKGFTLAETLITLTILGVVASITIPALINKYIEATNRVKVKKAMAAYEKAVDQMVVENNISGSIKSWADEVANCGRTNPYFKVISGANCRFQTSDKVWWDITDIEHPVIAFNEEDLDDANAAGRFVLLAKSDGAILRVNDPSTSPLTTEEQEALEDLYAFIENRKENLSAGSGTGTGQGDTPRCSLKEGSETEYKCTGSELIWAQMTIGDGDGITLTESDYGDSFCSWEKNEQGTYVQTCDIESVATEGPLYISEKLTLTESDAKSAANCAESRNKSYCEENGDYWILAKRQCESEGGRLPTSAELKVMKEKGQLDSVTYYYWAAEAYPGSTDASYTFLNNTYSGEVTDGDVDGDGRKAVCVGN